VVSFVGPWAAWVLPTAPTCPSLDWFRCVRTRRRAACSPALPIVARSRGCNSLHHTRLTWASHDDQHLHLTGVAMSPEGVGGPSFSGHHVLLPPSFMPVGAGAHGPGAPPPWASGALAAPGQAPDGSLRLTPSQMPAQGHHDGPEGPRVLPTAPLHPDFGSAYSWPQQRDSGDRYDSRSGCVGAVLARAGGAHAPFLCGSALPPQGPDGGWPPHVCTTVGASCAATASTTAGWWHHQWAAGSESGGVAAAGELATRYCPHQASVQWRQGTCVPTLLPRPCRIQRSPRCHVSLALCSATMLGTGQHPSPGRGFQSLLAA
jgi:hypothetical protein